MNLRFIYTVIFVILCGQKLVYAAKRTICTVSTGMGDSVWCSTRGAGNSVSVVTHVNSAWPSLRECVGRGNEYQPKGGDALQLGSKGRYGS